MTAETPDTRQPAGLDGAAGYQALLVAALVLSLAVWPLAFTLGTHGVVLYSDVFRVVVASTAAFLVTFVAPRGASARRWWSRSLLAAPAAWLAVAVTFTDSVAAAATDPFLGAVALLVALTAVPYAVYLLATALEPSLRQIREPRPIVALLLITTVITVSAFLAGAFNDRVLTCDDFKVAGDDPPENCARQQG